MGEKAVNSFVFISEKFNTTYYTAIADNNPYIFAEKTNYIIILISSIILACSLLAIVIKKDEIRERINDNLSEIKKIRKTLTGEEVEEEKPSKEKLIERVLALEEINKSQKHHFDKRDNTFISVIILSFLLIISLFFSYIYSINVTRKNIDFTNKTTIVLPYIGQESVNKLKSSWTQMTTKNDYIAITKELETYEKSIPHGTK